MPVEIWIASLQHDVQDDGTARRLTPDEVHQRALASRPGWLAWELTLGVLAETALPLLQDSRFREPAASEASLAAARQRAEQAEAHFSMSA